MWKYILLLIGCSLLASTLIPCLVHCQNDAQDIPHSTEDDIYIAEEEELGVDDHATNEDSYYFTQTQVTSPPAESSCGHDANHAQDKWTFEGARNTDSQSEKFLVLLSTLDGHIVALDASEGGREAWSLLTDSQPLFSSTLKNQELYPYLDYRLIPSLEGSMYYYKSGILQPMPMNAEALLNGRLQVGYDAVSGGKHVTTYGINAYSGKLYYSCSMNGCVNSAEASRYFKDSLIVRRKTQTVRAVDTVTGQERWNVTVGEHELLMTKEGIFWYDKTVRDNPTCAGADYAQEFWRAFENVRITMDPPTGVVRAVDMDERNGEPLWTRKLVSDFGFDQHHRNEVICGITPFALRTFNKDLYVIPSPNERRKLKRLHLAASASNLAYEERQMEEELHNLLPGGATEPSTALARLDAFEPPHGVMSYKKPTHYAMTGISQVEDGCHTETKYRGSYENCPTCSKDELNSMLLREHQPETDNGWYLFKTKRPLAGNRAAKKWRENLKSHVKEKIVSSGLIEVLWTWWKAGTLMFLTSLATVVTLKHYGFVNFGKNAPARLISQRTTTSDASGQTLSTNIGDSESAEGVMGTQKRKTESGSRASFDNVEFSAEEDFFSSRYLNDFEAVRCLGKGGFGVVFKSRNKMDDMEYAVKRIAVTNNEKSRERVVREVKMLAKLDHPGIVRYFNSWIECPPANWQEHTDKELLEKCGGVQKISVTEGFDPTSLATTEKSGSSLKNYNMQIQRNGEWTKEGKEENESLARELDAKLFKFGFGTGLEPGGSSVVFRNDEISETESSRRTENSLAESSVDIRFESTKSDKKDAQANQPISEGLTKMYLYIQMQLCQELTLRDFFEANNCAENRKNRDLYLNWFAQILMAVEYVHDCGLIHRDLKPSNIFFAQNGQIKVGDFGLATGILEDEAAGGDMGDSGFYSQKTVLGKANHTGHVGTQIYMSPEQLAGQTYSSKVDVFSMGLIFLELLIPFGTQMERIKTLQDLRNQKLPPEFQKENQKESEFVLWLATPEPEKRPNCMEIRDSKFVVEEIFEPGIYCALPPVRSASKRERSRTGSSNSSFSTKFGERISTSSPNSEHNSKDGT